MKKLVTLVAALYSITAFAQNSNFRRDSLYKILKQATTPAEQVNAWVDISGHYAQTGEPDSSRFANEQILNLASATQQDSLLSIAYGYIGNYFSNISDYKQALEFEFKSLALAEKSKNIYDIWLETKEVGVSFKKLKKYEEALRY